MTMNKIVVQIQIANNASKASNNWIFETSH